MEQNFEKLEELIKDDDKIVSVASFAFEANVSIKESKEIIEKYVEIHKESKQINVTYVLNGKKKEGGKLSVSLVKDDSLEAEKELYEACVKQIIFSIQKAKNIDFNVIALIDPVRSQIEDSVLGAVVSKNCKKRVLHKKVLPTLPPASLKGKLAVFTKHNSAVKSENVKSEKDDGDSNQNSKNKVNTQGNIANLFNKAAQNKKSEQRDIKQPEKKQKTNGGLTSFFNRQPSKDSAIKGSQNNEVKKEKQETICKGDMKADILRSDTDDDILKDLEIQEKEYTAKKKEIKTNPTKKHNNKSDLFDSDTDEEILMDLEVKVQSPLEKKREKKKEPVKNSQNKNKNNQKKRREKKDLGNEKSAKKRKRIIVDESDSDDIFASDKSDNEGIIENSNEEPEPAQVEKKPLAPKNKRRKAVEKIYEDEDGYIVTKTEYIYETPSEDENEPENKIAKVEEKPKIEKKGSSNSENDISPNKGHKNKKGTLKKAPSGNQPTLMNFFKKK